MKLNRSLLSLGLFVCSLCMICFCHPLRLTADEAVPIQIDFSGAAAESGLPSPWKLKINNGSADINVIHRNNENILFLRCSNSSFSLERDIAVSTEENPYVTWRWKAIRLPLSGDVRKKGRNDQGLQLLLAFENKKIISYVWDANAPRGTVTDESLGWPFNLSIKVIVVNSGNARINEWVSNTRNIHDDYKNLFNEEPPRLVGLRVQANTQYTGDLSEGMVRRIIFSGKET